MFWGLSDPHPNPLDRGMDTRVQIRILTKMSRIHNTAVFSIMVRARILIRFIELLGVE
jgi:hypothetical protein